MSNLNYPYYNKSSIEKVKKILKSGRVNYWTGDECKNFEKEFSNYHNVKYSLSVSNGSVALEMALKALNLKKTDSVIVTPRSFVASASCATADYFRLSAERNRPSSSSRPFQSWAGR